MYYLELTDNELKNLAGILGNFIGKKKMKATKIQKNLQNLQEIYSKR